MTGGDERPLARFSRGLLMFQLVVVAGTLCFPTLAGTIQLDTKSRDKPRELVRHAEKAIWGVFGDLSVPNQSLPGENRTIACYRDRVCAMENKHGLTASIPVHEGMMPLCGDGHWTVLANLGNSPSVNTTLRISPCGTFVVTKHTNDPGFRHRVQTDCAAITALNGKGIAPAFAVYSNRSGICYQEYVRGTPLGKFLLALLSTDLSGNFTRVRDAFATTLPLLRALSEAGVKHRALFPRNVIVTKGLSGYGEVPPTSIKLIDFMWAGMAGFPQPSAEHLSKHAGYTMSPDWSTHGYSDSYALGCSIGRVLFCGHNRRKGSCGGATGCLPDQQAVRADTASLEYVLWKMTAPNHAKRFSDLDEIATALARTTHMFDLSSDGDSDSGKESVQY